VLPVVAAAAGLIALVAAARQDEEAERAEARDEEDAFDALLDAAYLRKGKLIKVSRDKKELFRGRVLSVDFYRECAVLELVVLGNQRDQPKKLKVWHPRGDETVVPC
jgi:hypothetical protein